MAVPLAVKDLRPLRGAFGVLDREPLARHRQMEGQAWSLPQQAPRSPVERTSKALKFVPHTCHTDAETVAELGGERPRLTPSELGIRRVDRSPWLSSKQPVGGSSPSRRAT